MPWTSEHIKWLVDTAQTLKSADGIDIKVLEFRHERDDVVLSAWAKHFRNHYCLDSDIDFMRGEDSRGDYLTNLKFPSDSTQLGPAVRAGDFAEILVADYLEWVLSFWIPRVRWSSKAVRDESSKGSDVIGFKIAGGNGSTSRDAMVVFEVKAKFSKGTTTNRLQDAINGSAKDHVRIAESLHFIKQKLFYQNQSDDAKLVERFQSPVDRPFEKLHGAAAVFTLEEFDVSDLTQVDALKIPVSSKSTEVRAHPFRDQLILLVISGQDMMNLVHDLYRRASDEA